MKSSSNTIVQGKGFKKTVQGNVRRRNINVWAPESSGETHVGTRENKNRALNTTFKQINAKNYKWQDTNFLHAKNICTAKKYVALNQWNVVLESIISMKRKENLQKKISRYLVVH